ncbi:MAG TPA: TIGR01906 family membrane protein [Clostridia bacterium]|nr:TIGR01906 family membrane protein [Clostridia bacterium]
MKKISVIFVALFIVLMPIMLVLTDVQVVAYDRDYYRTEYIKYNVPEQIGMSIENLMLSTEQLLLYLEDKRADLEFKAEFTKGAEEFFSERDKQHMVDVKGLFVKGQFLRNLSFFYIVGFMLFLFWRRNHAGQLRRLAKYGIAVAIAGTAPVLILVALMNIDFYKYFTIFHEIFFTNDLWLLDPAADRLINIFPEAFFTDMAFSISYLYMAEMAAILVGSLLILRFAKAKAN